MSVIVDTSVWSLALRRQTSATSNPVVERLKHLISDDQVTMVGTIRQEILSGIKHSDQFNRLRDYLRAFPDIPLSSEDYELAATFFNTCRSQGVQGSNTDFLICAIAHYRNFPILTTDKDFKYFQQYIPVHLLLDD